MGFIPLTQHIAYFIWGVADVSAVFTALFPLRCVCVCVCVCVICHAALAVCLVSSCEARRTLKTAPRDWRWIPVTKIIPAKEKPSDFQSLTLFLCSTHSLTLLFSLSLCLSLTLSLSLSFSLSLFISLCLSLCLSLSLSLSPSDLLAERYTQAAPAQGKASEWGPTHITLRSLMFPAKSAAPPGF